MSTCWVMDWHSTIRLICRVVGLASSLCMAKVGKWGPPWSWLSPKSTTSFMDTSTSKHSQTKAGVPALTLRRCRLPFALPLPLWWGEAWDSAIWICHRECITDVIVVGCFYIVLFVCYSISVCRLRQRGQMSKSVYVRVFHDFELLRYVLRCAIE